MMQGMMNGEMHAMMWGIGLFWVLVILALILGIAALIKYLFGGDRL